MFATRQSKFMEVQHIEQWSKDQVKEWIIKEGFSECSNLFYENSISGDILLTLSQEDFHSWLKECKVPETKRSELYWTVFKLKKYFIESQLNLMDAFNKSIDEKDFTLASLSRQLQDVKGEIIGVKAMSKMTNATYDDSSKKYEYLSKGGDMPSTRIYSRSRSIDESHANIVSQASAASAAAASANSLSRMPSKLRTKKSPKTPSGTSFFSPESSKSSPAPVKTPTLTEKQEQILKNAMELYGHKPSASKSSKSKYGPSSGGGGASSSSWFS